jgi:hypothetical protein
VSVKKLDGKGLWWLPSDPETRLPGTLSVENGRIHLDLFGTFQDDPEEVQLPHSPNLILGNATSGRITLTGAYRSSWKFGTGPTLTRYEARVGYLGCHAGDGEDEPRFLALGVSYSNLGPWSRLSGFNHTWKPNELGGIERFTVEYAFPDRPIIRVRDFEVQLRTHLSVDGGLRERVDAVQSVMLEVRPVAAPLSLSRYLEDYFSHLQNFLTIGMGRPALPTRIRGIIRTADTRSGEAPVEITIGRQKSGERVKEISEHDMLFTFADVEGNAEQVLTRLFDRAAHLDAVFDLYFGAEFSSEMYLQHRFLSFAQAAEVYHRRTTSGGFLVEDQFSRTCAALKRLLHSPELSLPKDARTVLLQRSTHWNDLSLRRRLRALVTEFGDVLAPLIPDPRTFAGAVTDARNYPTHYDPKAAAAASDLHRLYELTEQLKAVLQLCLLRELGLPDKVMWLCVRKTQRRLAGWVT